MYSVILKLLHCSKRPDKYVLPNSLPYSLRYYYFLPNYTITDQTHHQLLITSANMTLSFRKTLGKYLLFQFERNRNEELQWKMLNANRACDDKRVKLNATMIFRQTNVQLWEAVKKFHRKDLTRHVWRIDLFPKPTNDPKQTELYIHLCSFTCGIFHIEWFWHGANYQG